MFNFSRNDSKILGNNVQSFYNLLLENFPQVSLQFSQNFPKNVPKLLIFSSSNFPLQFLQNVPKIIENNSILKISLKFFSKNFC